MEATKEKVCTLCGAEGHTAGGCKWAEGLPQSLSDACSECVHPGDCERARGCERLHALAKRLRAALERLEGPQQVFVVMREELRLAAAVARRAGFLLRLVSLDDNWAQLSLTEAEAKQVGAMVKFIT